MLKLTDNSRLTNKTYQGCSMFLRAGNPKCPLTELVEGGEPLQHIHLQYLRRTGLCPLKAHIFKT